MEAQVKPKTKGTKQLSQNWLVERITRTHIAVPLTVFTIISSGLIYYGVSNSLVSGFNALLLFVLGLLFFTLVEYIMHRFLFHLTPTTKRAEKAAYVMHGVHHDYPKDKDRLAMPIPASLLLSYLFYLLYSFIMGNAVFGFLPGFLMGYASYLWVHYMVHAFQPPKNFFKVLWIHHGIHHYKDDKNAFGVSSPLWDWVFGTMPK